MDGMTLSASLEALREGREVYEQMRYKVFKDPIPPSTPPHSHPPISGLPSRPLDEMDRIRSDLSALKSSISKVRSTVGATATSTQASTPVVSSALDGVPLPSYSSPLPPSLGPATVPSPSSLSWATELSNTAPLYLPSGRGRVSIQPSLGLISPAPPGGGEVPLHQHTYFPSPLAVDTPSVRYEGYSAASATHPVPMRGGRDYSQLGRDMMYGYGYGYGGGSNIRSLQRAVSGETEKHLSLEHSIEEMKRMHALEVEMYKSKLRELEGMVLSGKGGNHTGAGVGGDGTTGGERRNLTRELGVAAGHTYTHSGGEDASNVPSNNYASLSVSTSKSHGVNIEDATAALTANLEMTTKDLEMKTLRLAECGRDLSVAVAEKSILEDKYEVVTTELQRVLVILEERDSQIQKLEMQLQARSEASRETDSASEAISALEGKHRDSMAKAEGRIQELTSQLSSISAHLKESVKENGNAIEVTTGLTESLKKLETRYRGLEEDHNVLMDSYRKKEDLLNRAKERVKALLEERSKLKRSVLDLEKRHSLDMVIMEDKNKALLNKLERSWEEITLLQEARERSQLTAKEWMMQAQVLKNKCDLIVTAASTDRASQESAMKAKDAEVKVVLDSLMELINAGDGDASSKGKGNRKP